MKILAPIPVEKVRVTAASYTYRTELMEVEPLRYLRRPCGARGEARRRFFYTAIIKLPKCLPEDYPIWRRELGEFQVEVLRRLNPRWSPPVFPEGVNVVEVSL